MTEDAHVPDAVLAAFLDGTLPADERPRVEAHLAACDDCYVVFAETVRALPESAAEAARPGAPARVAGDAGPVGAPARGTGTRAAVIPFHRRRLVAVAATLVAAAAVLLLVARVQPSLVPGPLPRWLGVGHGTSSELQALVAAVGETRPVEGRLTGGFRYGPLTSPTRGPGRAEDWRVLAAAGQIREQAGQHESPANTHALGVAHLVLGEADEAVSALEAAIRSEPGHARFQSDLAAAFLARAKHLDRPEDYLKALAAAERAVQADPRLPEALFNRALALEALSLNDQARAAWDAYLHLDPDGPWAEEAKRHAARSIR